MGLATIGLLGAGVSALGSAGSGLAASGAASYQSQIAENNARVAEQNAGYASAAGKQSAETQSLQGAAQEAKVKASQAANGIDVNTGSAVGVQRSQAEIDQLNTENVMQNANLQAYGYRTQAQGFQQQSGLDEAESTGDMIGGAIGAGGSLLSNASSVGFKFGTPSWLTTG